MDVVETIEKEIRDRGMTYTFISKKTGININRLSGIFLRKRIMRTEELVTLCTFLNIDMNQFKQPVSDQDSA